MTLQNLIPAIQLIAQRNNAIKSGVLQGIINSEEAINNSSPKLRKTIDILDGLKNSIINVSAAFKSGGIKGGFKEIGSSIGSFVKANGKFLTSLSALATVYAALKIVDTFIFDADEKFEKATNAVSEYQNTVSKLESVNSELDSIGSQMDELKAKGHLSLVEQEELENLDFEGIERSAITNENRTKVILCASVQCMGKRY